MTTVLAVMFVIVGASFRFMVMLGGAVPRSVMIVMVIECLASDGLSISAGALVVEDFFQFAAVKPHATTLRAYVEFDAGPLHGLHGHIAVGAQKRRHDDLPGSALIVGFRATSMMPLADGTLTAGV